MTKLKSSEHGAETFPGPALGRVVRGRGSRLRLLDATVRLGELRLELGDSLVVFRALVTGRAELPLRRFRMSHGGIEVFAKRHVRSYVQNWTRPTSFL